MTQGISFGRAGKLGRPPGIRMNFGKYVLFLLFAGLISISPLGQGIAIVAAITVIGIPITALIMLIPTLAFFAGATWVLDRVLGRFIAGSLLAAGLIVLALMVVIPWVQNLRIENTVSALITDDVAYNPADRPDVTGNRIFAGIYSVNSKSVCDQLCQNFLVSGEADVFIVAREKNPVVTPDFSTTGTAWSLVKQDVCNVEKQWLNRRFFDRFANYDGVREALERRFTEGYCLISRERSIADAGIVIHSVSRWGKNPNEGSLNPFAELYYAERSALYEKGSDGGFEVRMQRTAVSYSVLGPILAHAYGGGAELMIHSDLWRWKESVNGGVFKSYSIKAFLENDVGLRLKVPKPAS